MTGLAFDERNIEAGRGKHMCARNISFLMTVIMICLMLLTMSSCSIFAPEFKGDYQDIQKVAWELRLNRYDSDKSCVRYENSDTSLPRLILHFKDEKQAHKVCDKLKKKLKDKDVPWLEITNYHEAAYEALNGLDCESFGLAVLFADEYDSAADFIKENNVKKLLIEDDKAIAAFPKLESVEELWLVKSSAGCKYLEKFPSVTTLWLNDDESLLEAPQTPSLKHIYDYAQAVEYRLKSGRPYFNAAVSAFLTVNPQIETVNGMPAQEYIKTIDLNDEELIEYNKTLQRVDCNRIDLSDYKVIPFDDAILHGKVAIIGFDEADISNFECKDGDLSDEVKAILADDPLQRDVIIRVTTESVTEEGYYDDGSTGYGMNVYFEVIDPSKKTITEKDKRYNAPPMAVINGGSHSRSFSPADVWYIVDELYNKSYQK